MWTKWDGEAGILGLRGARLRPSGLRRDNFDAVKIGGADRALTF